MFVVGNEEEELKAESLQLSLPPQPRSLDQCVAILNNPEVSNENNTVKVLYRLTTELTSC